jgi:ribosomal-protein-alanine N-acetyltransferase
MTTLQSSRLILRDIQQDDWKAVHSYSRLDEVVRYQPWGPNSEEESQQFVFVAVEASRASPRTVYHLAVIEISTDHVIGTASLKIRTEHSRSDGEIGYVLHPDVWKRGYATEAARLLLRFGFEDLRLLQIMATCDPRNVASSRVLEKIGMRYARRDLKAMLIRDGWRDSDVYILDRPGWDRSQGLPGG